MDNLKLTNQILCNNVKGSFLMILYRDINPEDPIEFISDMKISVYHFLLLKENKTYSFPDIMESFSYEPYEINFNNLESKGQGHFYISESMEPHVHTIKDCKGCVSKKQQIDGSYEAITKILTNQSIAMMYIKDEVFGKIAHYKIDCMRGQDISTYHAHCTGAKLDTLDCIHKEDILDITGQKGNFINWFERAL